MPRTIDAATQTANESPVITRCALAFFDFPGTPIYVTDVPFTVPYDGNDYLGVGNLGQISELEEGAELEARNLVFRISIVNPASLSQALAPSYVGRAVEVREANLDPVTHAIIGVPILWWAGVLDEPEIEIDPETGNRSLTVAGESVFVTWEKARSRFRTNEDQQARFAGDKFFEFKPQIADKEIKWGV